jgi:hypothetical protein
MFSYLYLCVFGVRDVSKGRGTGGGCVCVCTVYVLYLFQYCIMLEQLALIFYIKTSVFRGLPFKLFKLMLFVSSSYLKYRMSCEQLMLH